MAFYSPPCLKYSYDPRASEPYRLSRSGIDLYVECPRCFYLDKRLGIGRPPGFPFSLNSAVDFLLKKEFDLHRAKGDAHPLMDHYGVKAVPFAHKDLDEWRENFKGIRFKHDKTGFIVTGAIDDVWINENKELIIVDYKATSKDGEVNLDAPWQDGYKRQMEIYQWLFRKNGFNVSKTGYFVYCNGIRDKEAFDAKLEFNIKLIPHIGDDSWIEETLLKIKKCLDNEIIPEASEKCDYCRYRKASAEVERDKTVKNVMIADQINGDGKTEKTKEKKSTDFKNGKLF